MRRCGESMRISKSRFVAGVQCLKRLYWQVHSPELAAQPDVASEAIIQQGREVGMIARQLFPGGVEVRNDAGLDQAIHATRELVANPTVPAVFEGVFEHENVLVKVDILHRRCDGRWRLIEVKSTTDVKDHHLEDVAIQYRVVSRSGLDIGSCYLAHVNRAYVFRGGSVDPWRFFRIRNVTRQVAKLQPKLTFQLRAEFTVLSMPTAPQIGAGRHCVAPITCEFYDQCNPPRPHNHVGFLPRIHASAMEELDAMGVESIMDIPDDFELTEIQQRAAECVRTGNAWYDRVGLEAKLEALIYPITYLDFETINPAIPRFADTHPHQPIPFQWSAHIQQRPGAEPQHYEFLATDANDPRREFISSLLARLSETGSIVVYSSFESQRLSEFAASLPESADRISAIQARLFDLLPIVREHVYHPAFAGSYSIKSVLPALVPAMTYDGMPVANGLDARLAWESLTRGNVDAVERGEIEKALLEYCGLDTLALLRLVEVLRLAKQT